MSETATNTKSRIKLKLGDITEIGCDAIVNAANNDLQLGGGVAGAIRRKGGPSIQEECHHLGPIAVGDAAITGGGDLRARYVIHAASMQLGARTTESHLRSSVERSLQLADQHKLRSIAFPAVGAGIAGFPLGRCAEVMMEAVGRHLDGGSGLEQVIFVLFDQRAYDAFEAAYGQM
ncbi:MAG: macro domain-containing protein [Planctomycetes bacterium]|nr:macro domain-containing protein [Planctomycetota bacterium]